MDKQESVVSAAIGMLGQSARDRVTKFEGVVGSINFDAYGCVQAWLIPPAKDGKLPDGYWFDIKRIELLDPVLRVMPVPNFLGTKYGEEQGGNLLPGVKSPAPPTCG